MLHSLLVSVMVVAGVGLGHFLDSRNGSGSEGGSSAEAKAEAKCSVSVGARMKAGEQGRGALPLSCGSGMRATQASGPLPALCLSAPRAAAQRCGPGRGGDRGAGRGFSRAEACHSTFTVEWRHLSSLLASSLHI